MDTNASMELVAQTLADARRGTFSGLIIRKKGKEAGRGAARKVYGDDLVHVVLVTGFDYGALVQRSFDILAGVADDGVRLTNQEVLDALAAKKKLDKDGKEVTLETVKEARREVLQSLSTSMQGPEEDESTPYEPLLVDGETVRGAKVYVGMPVVEGAPVAAKSDRSPVVGTVYLAGLKISEKVITPAVNGWAPEPKSAALTLAKAQIRRMLPVGRYVSYALAPDKDFVIKVGGAAALAATQGGLRAEPVVLREIARILASNPA